jgi:hypothetical protein
MRLKDLYSFKIVRATQRKDRKEELEMLTRIGSSLLYWNGELVKARDYAKDMYSGFGCSSSFLRDSKFLVEEEKEKILSKLDSYKKALLRAIDLFGKVPFEEEVDEFTRIVNKHKAEIKDELENGLMRLEAAINVCRDIDLSSTRTCRESSRKCYELIDETFKVLGPTTAFIYTLISELETGIIP